MICMRFFGVCEVGRHLVLFPDVARFCGGQIASLQEVRMKIEE